MFRCEYNNELSNPYEKPVVLVTQTRVKQYTAAIKDDYGNVLKDQNGEPVVEVVGTGIETVKSIKVRASNLEKAKKKHGIA